MWTVNGVEFDADAQAAVNAVNTAANQVALLEALQSTYFVDVDDAKITDYFAEMNGNTYADVAEVQEAIDKVNDGAVDEQLISDIVDAMTDNNEVALLALLGDESFERVNADLITQYMAEFNEKINDGLLEDYRTGIVTGTITDTASINTIIQTANSNTAELAAVASYAGSDADALLALLKDKKLALTNVVDANKDAYLADLALITTEATTPKTVADLEKAIDTVNFVADANDATTAAEMQAALTGISVNESVSAYIVLSSAAKAEVAELVLVERAEQTGEVYADLAAVSGEISTQTTAYTGFLTGVNAATDIDAMMTALDMAAFPAYQDLGTVEKVEKAELVLDELTRLKALDTPSSFKTIAEIKTAAGL